MSSLDELSDDITALTGKLKEEKPAVYKLLSENPKTISNSMEGSMKEELKKYRDNLVELLKKNQ